MAQICSNALDSRSPLRARALHVSQTCVFRKQHNYGAVRLLVTTAGTLAE